MSAPRPGPAIRTSAGFGGLGLNAKIMLTLGVGLALLMTGLGTYLVYLGPELTRSLQQRAIEAAMPLSHKKPEFARSGGTERLPGGDVTLTPAQLSGAEGARVSLYEYQEIPGRSEPDRLFVPASAEESSEFLGLAIKLGIVVVLGGLLIGAIIAEQVKKPLVRIAERIRQMSGDGERPRGARPASTEVEVLAHSVGRVSRTLAQAREAEEELSVRQRELGLAASVREALLPERAPSLAGWDAGALHLPSEAFGGDFHDYIELADGRIGLLACDVSGQGIPAAMIGAAARSYLRSELARGSDPALALQRVNRELARDVRRGMYVTVLYALVDPAAARVQIACAGHKIPLLRYRASDGKLLTIQPEGIAIGLDRGPVFDRSLKLQELLLEPGDRILLSNTGPVRLIDAEGQELGEKAFFKAVLRAAPRSTSDFLAALRAAMEEHAGEHGLSCDISLITIARRRA